MQLTSKIAALSLALVALAAPSAFAQTLKVQGQEFMPFQGMEGGKPGGAYVKLTELACKKAGVTCQFEIVPLNRSIKMLEDGEAHMVLTIAPIPIRKAIANFPDTMTTTGYTFFVKKGQAGKFTKSEDFKGKQVAVYGPSATEKSLEKLNESMGKAIKVEIESTNQDVPFKKLDGGRYGDDGAVFASRPVGLYIAKTQKLNIEPVAFDAEKARHAVAIGKKGVDEATTKKLIAAFNEVMKSPEAKKIIADYDLAPWDGK